ncbi:hypothetical protein MNBD_CHLOROFLEXI01-3172 [hydrothermal vent metagenome]|uniref:SCP domain-containing protein n=1 Tax=hydrothermal vent metagenome TaxID=652676 RepID=A0A3B0V104_9ZZZZ
MRKLKAWTLIGIFLLLTLLIWNQSSQADDLSTDDIPIATALGEPAQGTAVSPPPTITPPTPKNVERPSGSPPLYLPLVIMSLSPEAQEVVDLINVERVAAGCNPLQVNNKLVAAAQGHSEDMALNDFFSHTGSNGSSPGDRIAAEGYSYSTWGENIAAGYATAGAAVNGWVNSPGHLANLLNCNYQETGVGYYFLENDTGSENWFYYWTQVFASP